MANRPIDDFDPRSPHDEAATHDEPHEMIDDEADFGGAHHRRAQASHPAEEDLHDDADFVDDDMNDIVDDADPLADDEDDHQESDHAYDEDEPGELERETDAEMEKAKSFNIGSLIFYIIIAGVVAGGGYMAYRTFMTGGEPVSPGNVLQAAGNATEKAAGVIVPTDNSAPTPAPTPADNSAPVPTPTPVEANNNWQTTLPEDPAAAAPQVLPAAQAQMQPVTQPSAPTVTTAAAVPTIAAGATAAPLAATVANTEAMAGMNARLADTESRLQQMTANVSTLTQNLQASQARVAELEKRPATTTAAVTAPPAISASDLAAMKAENAKLQQQVAQLTRTQQSLQTQLQSASRTATTAAETAQATAAAKPASSPKVTTAKTTAPKAAAKPSSMAAMEDNTSPAEPVTEARSPKTRAPAATVKNTWVLRAATPGMAWVSPQPGSAELKRVVPGDTVAGIGQVTAIRQEAGRWIVEGSSGTIR